MKSSTRKLVYLNKQNRFLYVYRYKDKKRRKGSLYVIKKKILFGQKGFTLIEMLVIISIMAIIALIAIPRYAGMQERAKVDADEATARQIVKVARIITTDNEISEPDLDADAAAAVSYPGAGNSWSYGGGEYLFVPEPQQNGGTDFELSHASGLFTVSITGTSNSVIEGQ